MLNEEYWESTSRWTVKSGVGFVGFSTLSVSSSPKEAIDYIKGLMLAGVRYELVCEKATPLKEVAWRNLLPFYGI